MSSNNKATYNNKLSIIAKNRIMADRNMAKRDKKQYDESDIYFLVNDEILDNKFKLLMVGSRDIQNPYFGGFFTFNGTFPDQYPFHPPQMKCMTQGENTRFHPNYYANGKCCVSILGTWSGPPWTSCQNMATVAQTLKSLYIENPITQEPSWENCTDNRAKTYANIVAYRCLQIAVLRMIEHPPSGFESFIPLMEKEFLTLYPKYMEKLKSMKLLEGKYAVSPIYGMTLTYEIKKLVGLFKAKYKLLSKKYPDLITQDGKIKKCKSKSETKSEAKSKDKSNKTTENDEDFLSKATEVFLINSNNVVSVNSVNNDNEEFNKLIATTLEKSKKRKSPDESSKNFPIGHKIKSQNDGNIWKVGKTKNGVKRWKKCVT